MSPGLASDQSAYCSELGGVIGSLTLLLAVCKSFGIQDGLVTLALDGEAAMNQAMQQVGIEYPLRVYQKHFDFLQVFRSLLKLLPIKWRWVESHQREHGVTRLDWWAKKNDWCDKHAKFFGRECRTVPIVSRPHLFGESVVFSVDDGKLAFTLVDDLYSRTFGKCTLAYWRNR